MTNSCLKIAFLTPYYHQGRGNATTARRIEHGLKEKGIDVFVFAFEEETFSAEVKERIQDADVVHVLQFARFSNWLQKHPNHFRGPFVVTTGGTDINHSLEEDQDLYLPLLKQAKAITVFTNEAKKYLIHNYHFKEKSIHVIPQSLFLPESHNEVDITELLPTGNPRILLPAGLRPVKDVLYALPAIQKLQEEYGEIVFLVLGANLDQSIYTQIQEEQKRYEWFHYMAEVELSLMKEVYRWSDIVINTSVSEGQPTSILEAMSERKPVVARNISGNSSIIAHGENGLLFSSAEELYMSLKELLENESLRKALSANACMRVMQDHSLEKEMDAYIKVYKHIKES